MLHRKMIALAHNTLVPRMTMQQELMEYQQLKQEVDEIECRLEEFCSAIQDFSLNETTLDAQDTREIYCSACSYTPYALLAQAKKESAQLERTTVQMNEARGRVLAKILHETDNVNECRAMHWACVDLSEQWLKPNRLGALA